ncbi:MAG: hypothetical protein II680_13205, partial [Clostridia bacterium]|nr:hypothetical protein [Clostridia bacterium]
QKIVHFCIFIKIFLIDLFDEQVVVDKHLKQKSFVFIKKVLNFLNNILKIHQEYQLNKSEPY